MLSEAQIIPCQICKGSGKVGPVHINRGSQGGEWLGSMACNECGGTGSWDIDHWNRFQIGREMRVARIDREETLLAASRRLGISPSELSGIERGRLPKTKAGRAVLKAREAGGE